ncbi:MAG: hypothetical protein IKN54_02565, partial [Lachnospiraceae bacterium]|nr:hypothetical protein [Lachnospiraceae bacterium]
SGAVVIKNGEETLATINSVASDGTWTASINGSSITANTAVDLTIQAKDCVGKTSDAATYTVYKDTNPPVIAFTSPDGNLAQTEPLSGTSGIFSGTTSDTASGVASYSYVFSKSSTAPATGWTTVTNAVTSWSIPKTFTAGTGTAANDEGQWYLFVKAADKAGNETAAASSLSFWYDNSVPTLTTSMTTATGKCENKDGKYYFNGTIAANTALTGSITASDTSAVAPTISYKIGSGTEVAITGITPTDGTCSGTWSIPSSAFTQDGEYTVKIIATDQCGRKAEQTYNVYRDTLAPTITITAPAAATGTIVNTASYTFGGTIADPTFYSASAVLYKDTAATDTTTTIEVNDNNTWTWRPTGLEDGTYHIVVTAKDKVSNTATQTTGTVIVDRTAPATSIVPAEGNNITDASFAAVDELENGKTYYTSSSYTITGVINDNNWETGATAKYKIDNGAETTLTVNASTKAWSLSAATAGHTYEIKLKDSAENENTYSFTISYDATAPNASIAIPDADITNPLYALSTNNYSFKLSASDGGVGVKELSYIFTQTDSLPAANADWETDSNFTTADKYVVMDLVALNTVDSNSQTVENTLTATQLPEGIWYLWVKAKDKAGNETAGTSISANRRKIIVDKSAPTLTVTNSLSETGTNPIYEDVTNTGYTIGGTVSDTNDVAANDVIVIKVDGETKTTLAKTDLTGNTWSDTIPKASIHVNGLTEVEVIAKDVVGKTTSKKYNLYYDTADPELEVTAPVSDEQVENASKIIKGTVRDDGYGLARLEFALKNSSNVTVKDSSNNDISGYWEATANGSTSAGNYPLKIKGEQWFYAGQPDGEGNVAGNTALTIPLGTAEGTLKLVITATEKVVGNHTARTETEEITFYYDAAEPNITESGSVSRITNTDFVLTGTAYDTNQLAKIEIKQGGVLKATTADGSITFKASSAEDAAVVTLASATSDSAKGTWKATFDADDYAGGSYQFN